MLTSDWQAVLSWYVMLLAMGMAFWPLCRRLFPRSYDGGYAAAKVLSVALSGYVLWLAASVGLMPFARWSAAMVLCAFAGVSIYAALSGGWLSPRLPKAGLRRPSRWSPILGVVRRPRWRTAFLLEMLFAAALAGWAWMRAHQPDIRDLEKYMDFGFMNACLRADYFPPPDIWLSGHSVNYYYFGQYLAAFLVKLSGVSPEVGYNLALATVFALTFVMAAAVSANAIYLLRGRRRGAAPFAGGLAAGVLLTIGGNCHTFIYDTLPRMLHWAGLRSGQPGDYNFADASRYVNWPLERTISEFPAYSFVVADLHAHVVNLPLVLVMVYLSLQVMSERRKNFTTGRRTQGRKSPSALCAVFSATSAVPAVTHPLQTVISQWLLRKELCVAGVLLGIFSISNSWDVPTYFGLFGLAMLVSNFRAAGRPAWKIVLWTAAQAVVVVVVAMLISLPFLLHFKAPALGVCLAKYHSPLWQLAVLYGYQWLIAVAFLGAIVMAFLRWRLQSQANGSNASSVAALAKSQVIRPHHPFANSPLGVLLWFLIVLTMSTICVIIPEIVYVKDIYGLEFHRANTMFKVGYQAVTLLVVAVPVMAVFVVMSCRRERAKIAWAIALTAVMMAPLFFAPHAISSRYGRQYSHLGQDPLWPRRSLDGLAWMRQESPGDYAAIEHLRGLAKFEGCVLEAVPERSYDYASRISMATGIPTVMGWRWHQMLWRCKIDPMILTDYRASILARRDEDVRRMYTSGDMDQTRRLLRKYNVRYVVVGYCELDRYGWFDGSKFDKLGQKVLQHEGTSLYRIDTSAD